MKISFEKKIIFGFIINLLIVGGLAWAYLARNNGSKDTNVIIAIDWLTFFLFILSFTLLTIVYLIIRAQLNLKNIAQQLLFDNKQLLQSIIDNTTNSISIKLINGEYLLVNKQFETLFGISKDDVKGKIDHDFLPKEIANAYRNSDLEVVKAGNEMKFEEIIKNKFGDQTYLAVKFPLYDVMGRVYAVGAISTNISERKTTEDSFKSSDKFFNMSLEILVVASNDYFVKVNPALSLTVGYSEKELLEKPFLSFVYPDDLDKTKKELDKLKTGAKTIKFENRWTRKDGSVIWLSWVTSIDSETNLLYSAAHDITERILAEKQLKEVNSFLSSVLDNIPHMIFVKDANELRFLELNNAGEKMLGFNGEEWKGKNDFDYFPKDQADIYTSKDREVINNKKYLDIPEESMETKYGKRWLHTQKIPVIDETGEVLYLIGLSEDITERKKNEELLITADRFFNMSYDLLVVVKGEYFIKVNMAFTRILGYEQKDMDERPFLSFAHPDDVKKSKQILNSLKEGESFVSFKARVRCKDGTYKCLDWSITPDLQSGLIYAVARDITEQVRIERSFYKAYKFFNLSNEIFLIEKGDNFVKFNPAFTTVLGYHESEAEKIKPMNIIHPLDLESTKNELAKLMAGAAMVIFKERVLCMDGHYKWIEWSATAEKSSGAIYMIGRDISLLVENEKSIQIADKFFNMAFEMLIVGNENYFIKINPAVTATLGYTQEDMDKIKFLELSHPDDIQNAQDQIKKLLAGEPLVNYKSRFRCKDESYKWIYWSITTDLKLGMIYAVARDITQQIRLEKEQLEALNLLNENEEKLTLILENIGDGVIVANPEKKILLANYMANEIFEIEENETISFNFSDHFEIYFPDEKTVFPAQNLPTAKALSGETTEDVDIVLWDPAKQIKKRILVSGRPLVDQNNAVVAAVITIKDISKYKQLETELKESESKYRQLIGFKKNE